MEEDRKYTKEDLLICYAEGVRVHDWLNAEAKGDTVLKDKATPWFFKKWFDSYFLKDKLKKEGSFKEYSNINLKIGY